MIEKNQYGIKIKYFWDNNAIKEFECFGDKKWVEEKIKEYGMGGNK